MKNTKLTSQVRLQMRAPSMRPLARNEVQKPNTKEASGLNIQEKSGGAGHSVCAVPWMKQRNAEAKSARPASATSVGSAIAVLA